jgi:hypothetical protein
MKSRKLGLLWLAAGLMLSACAGSMVEAQDATDSGYQRIEVDGVSAEVGVGSPIPVLAEITGTLPDTCAQLDLVNMKQAGMDVSYELSTVASDQADCLPDPLPFRLRLPISVIGLPGGIYQVSANGVQGSFELDTDIPEEALLDPLSLVKEDIEVSNVAVEVGPGSPVSVHAVVDLNLPNSCAQLGELRLQRQEQAFTIRLISYTLEREGCLVDSIPFRAEIPLNMVNLAPGSYSVNVNGFETSFAWPQEGSDTSGQE